VEEPFEALEEMELRKPYRVGVIGLGNMGARYLEALHANPNYWVRWVSDKNPARLAWASELIHEVIAGEDADQLMEEVEVDILGVFTLADARPHFIRAALRRRQHVIAEKPIAASIPEEEALLREVEASDRLVAVNLFNRRFAPLELVGTLVGYGPRSYSEWGGVQGDGRLHLWAIGAKASDAMLSGSHRNARGGANAARLQRSGHKVSWGDSH
jgi:hypothetical protein